VKSALVGPDRLDDFLALPLRLHAGDPTWIPPLRQVLVRDLLGQGCFGRYAETQMILCEHAGQVVGRCTAVHNPRLPGIGQVGLFEGEDDEAILPSLLEVALPWLAERGAAEVWGPIDGGAHRTHRLMTQGFDRDPFLFEPRNPAHYPRLFEAAGFVPFHRWHSYELDPQLVRGLASRFERAVARALRTRTRELFDLSDPDLFPRLHRILDRVWSGHPGYAHLDLDEFVETYGGIVAVNPPEYLGVVKDEAGADVALGLCYPDFAAEVRALAGDASGWGSWAGGDLPRRLVLHSVAVVPEERGGGAAILIVDHAANRLLADGFEQVIVAMVTETFGLFDKFAQPTRSYALYRRPLR
jgi:GNAT superfamily N-acetyltransferase